jgi:enoyl-CoA hydratase/carnithine racemase
VPNGENMLLEAKRLALELASLPRRSLANTKTLLWSAPDHSSSELKLIEEDLFAELWSSVDRREAMSAFLEKGKPYQGRE